MADEHQLSDAIDCRSCRSLAVFDRDQHLEIRYLDLVSGVVVIVAYRPKPGKENELLELVPNRVPTLQAEGLVTDRAPIIMRARDGTIIEVSEWKSPEAIDAAHKNPNVLAMWNQFFAICECVPLKTLIEAEEMFAGFEPLN
jgi:quinol monooxygenase YgiN